jgi:hypothetical protein
MLQEKQKDSQPQSVDTVAGANSTQGRGSVQLKGSGYAEQSAALSPANTGYAAQSDAVSEAPAAKPCGSPSVQFYSVKPVGGRSAKVGEAGKTALMGGHSLYATSDLVADANTKLKGAGKDGSFIELSQGKDKVTNAGNELSSVMPVWNPKGAKDGFHSKVSGANKPGGKDTTGGTGPTMALWTDCGRSSGAVTGSKGGDRQGVYNDGGKEQTTRGHSDSSVSGWLDTEPGGMANVIYQQLMPDFIRDSANKRFLKDGVHFEKKGGKTVYIDGADHVDIKAKYYALGAKGRDKFDRKAGINHHANPDIGETYTMATEGDMPGFKETGGKTWNYHWGGVVMKDGSDNLTLENFAVTAKYAKSMGVRQGEFIDRDWNFDMYGTVDKDQTFHDDHLDSNTHGNRASTLRVRTDN